MISQGYVRFGVALVAALCLHALVFLILIPANDAKIVLIRPLQVTILPAEQKGQSKSNPEQNVAKNLSQQLPLQSTSEIDSVNDPEENESGSSEKEQADSAEQQLLVPEVVQASILAHVRYPNRARRHGWQGGTELQFLVQSEKVSQISVSVSSGFEALDAAAFQGLASVATLPLTDGNYRLPVIFRIE